VQRCTGRAAYDARPVRRFLLTLVAAAVALVPASSAWAAPELRTGIADDAVLLHDPLRAPAVVAEWAAVGIDTVRIHARWASIAPEPRATVQPAGFNAVDPDDPRYSWGDLDRAVDLVRSFGLEPMLTVTGSGPLWGTSDPGRGSERYKPHPGRFGQFAAAVARRYAGRVDRYLIWNEPNQPLWLQPQSDCPRGGRRCTPVAPHVYRRLVRAAYVAIHANDPVAQVIAGTLSPRGEDPVTRNRPLRPLRFLREFGCVDGRLRRVRTGPCRGFLPATVDGFAIHPHGVKDPPALAADHRDEVQLADLPKLERTLDAIQRTGGLRTRSGAKVPLHLTEYGYQTNPPDRSDGVTLLQQRTWLQQAAYLAWADPRVKTLVQYAWEDEAIRRLGPGRRAYAGWQSGLLFADGRPKPALSSFANPFWAAPAPDGRRVRFWGQVRPGTTHQLQLQRLRASGWRTAATLRTDRRGFWTLTRTLDRPASFRFRYVDAAGALRSSDVVRAHPPARRAPSARRG
jgi:hypothetical protein